MDIIGEAASDCAVLKGQTMDVLSGASVTFSIKPERGTYFGTIPFYNLGLQLPQIDHLRLSATSETVQENRRANITTDLDNNTRFRVHGNVVMPRVSADLSWNGTVDTDPIVDGSLELHSLGSTTDGSGSVGLVCCGAGTRVVRVVAEIQDEGGNWVPRGVARATLTKNDTAPLADAEVTGWQFCGQSGCTLPSGGGLPPP